ncbi:MAG TPA: HAMP domain-containing sensor histidine kinase [Stellaceae bacterium]|nr:HAMP domain-containing sensor histidine kinase [Stellaceae bacterium]
MAGAVLFTVVIAGACWWLARGKRQAETANVAKTRLLAALGDDLRKPLRDIARAGAAIDRTAFDPGEWDKIARMRLDARAMLLQLEDVRTCLDIESGSFAPETRSFDLHRLANGVVASLRPQAAERGIVIALRIDPLLPYQLRGWPHQLRQILIGLLTYAVQRSGAAKLRVVIDAAEVGAERVSLRVVVASGAVVATAPEETVEPPVAELGRPFGMAMVQRLAGLMGGRLAMEREPGGASRLTAELPFAIDWPMQALPLDLAHLPALIVTKDQNFVGEFVEPLDTWRAETRWIGAEDTALRYLEAFDANRRSLLIVDGRGDVLQALSFAHHAVSLPAGPPPYLLFVVDEARMDSVIGLADEDFDGILPAPFTIGALRGVLHAMRVEPADWFLGDALPTAPDEEDPAPSAATPASVGATIAPLEPAPRPAPAAIVTEIASHPRFAESGGAVIDERAVGALWSLGDGREFFDDVIEAFRADSRRAIGELSAAAAAADPHQFEEGVQALRRCTANFGSGRLRELLLSLRNLAPAELQRQGAAYVQRLEAEIGKLETTLVDYAKAVR